MLRISRSLLTRTTLSHSTSSFTRPILSLPCLCSSIPPVIGTHIPIPISTRIRTSATTSTDIDTSTSPFPSPSSPTSTSTSDSSQTTDQYQHIHQWIQQQSIEPRLPRQTDTITLGPLLRLHTSLNNEHSVQQLTHAATNQGIHPAAHWLYFLSRVPTRDLSPDGYERDFGPPAPFTRRMYAGGQIIYHQRILLKENLERSTRLANKPVFKEGRSVPLIFVSIENTITSSWGSPLITDIRHYVYRPESSDQQLKSVQVKKTDIASRPSFDIERAPIELNEALLFRYSALTFNAHRIHYDHEYARFEGYPAVLVHGPLSATLLLDLIHTTLHAAIPLNITPPAATVLTPAGTPLTPAPTVTIATPTPTATATVIPTTGTPTATLKQFTFRALAPLYVNTRVRILGARVPNATDAASVSAIQKLMQDDRDRQRTVQTWKLWCENASDATIRYMEAEAITLV